MAEAGQEFRPIVALTDREFKGKNGDALYLMTRLDKLAYF